MKKLIIVVLLLIIFGLYFFTDQTKGFLKKITGYAVKEGSEKAKEVIKENINSVNVTELKEDVKDLIKQDS